MGGIFLGSSAAREAAARRTRVPRTPSFFIAEILQHLNGLSSAGSQVCGGLCDLNGLFNQALASGVDEIGVGGLLPASAHFVRDLAAMVGRVEQHVTQDVFDSAGPGLSLAVLVVDFLREVGWQKFDEEGAPAGGELCDLRVALLEGKFWPHRKALRLALYALQPETLG